jgi:hypothetical protein
MHKHNCSHCRSESDSFIDKFIVLPLLILFLIVFGVFFLAVISDFSKQKLPDIEKQIKNGVKLEQLQKINKTA